MYANYIYYKDDKQLFGNNDSFLLHYRFPKLLSLMIMVFEMLQAISITVVFNFVFQINYILNTLCTEIITYYIINKNRNSCAKI